MLKLGDGHVKDSVYYFISCMLKMLHNKNESSNSRKPSEVNKYNAPCICRCTFTNSKVMTVERINLMTLALSTSIVELVLLNL